MPNRIKELREARGWTQEHLGELIGQSNSNINKLEMGRVELRERIIRKLAEVFEISISDMLEDTIKTPSGQTVGWPNFCVQVDVADFKPEKSHPINKMVEGDMHLYQVKSLVLDQIGLHPGDIVVAKSDQKSISQVRTGTLVIAEVGNDIRIRKSVMVMREFVEPNSLITNSSECNAAALRWSPHGHPIPDTGLFVSVVSVIVHSHRDHPLRPSQR